LGRLTSDVTWVQMDGIPVGSHKVRIRHENNNNSTTLVHRSGTQDLMWEACFPGSYAALQVDGVAKAARQKILNGVPVSYTTIIVAVGQQKTVSAPNNPAENKAP
jgi:hypothetical protein